MIGRGLLGRIGVALGLFALVLSVSASVASAQQATQSVTVYILRGKPYGLVGPDGSHHDTVAPSTFVLREGVRTTLTFVNYDEGPHSMNAPGLGLNIVVQPGHQLANKTVVPVTTTYTFTPQKTGDFRWNCLITCDKGGKYWAMSKGYDGADQDGYMAGSIIVIPDTTGAM